MIRLKKAIALSVVSALMFTSPFGMVAKAEENIKIDSVKIERENITDKKEKIEKIKKKLENEKKKFYKNKKNKGMDKSLLAKSEELNKDLNEIEKQIKELREEMKKVIKSTYTQEELSILKAAMEIIEKNNADIKTIPVENIITKKMNIKFDTPPVIKQGRTLIPVRAISEGFGADVKWNKDEQKVIITKGDVEIILQLADGKAFVNGEEKEIDVPAQLMSNRTLVPLRFIVENLGLSVDYDKDTQIIDIEENESPSDEQNVQVTDEEKIKVEDVDEDKVEVENSEEDTTEVISE